MNARMRLLLAVVVLTSIGFGTSGCKHDTLNSGTSALAVYFSPYTPAGSAPVRFDSGSFSIVKLQVLPTDPEAAAVYGNEKLQLAFQSYLANMIPTKDSLYSQIALPRGTYRVTKLTITHPSLVDQDLSPPFATCMDGVATVNASAVGAPTTTDFIDSPLTFTVQPEQTTLRIRLNVPGFVAAYEQAFTCQVGCGPQGTNCVVAPFNENIYRAAVLANLTFE